MASKGTPKNDAALIRLLAAGWALKHAAKAAGMSVRTADRRVADPAFAARVEAAKAELLRRLGGKLLDKALAGAAVLAAIATDTCAPAAARVAAAKALVETAVRVREADKLEGIAADVAAIKARGPGGGR